MFLNKKSEAGIDSSKINYYCVNVYIMVYVFIFPFIGIVGLKERL